MTNRTICDILSEMRDCTKTGNFSYLPGLIEEVQSAANRMEAAIWDQSGLEQRRAEYKQLKKDIRKLTEKRDELETSE